MLSCPDDVCSGRPTVAVPSQVPWDGKPNVRQGSFAESKVPPAGLPHGVERAVPSLTFRLDTVDLNSSRIYLESM